MPIIGLDARLRQCAATFQDCFSKPQRMYFVTVLLALMLCQASKTLTALLRQVADGPSLSDLSRFWAEAPWSAEMLAGTWLSRFRQQMQPRVEAEPDRPRTSRPQRSGRPKATVVTGYLIGDDSTMHKRKAKQMGGLGVHSSTPDGKRAPGHRRVPGLYVLRGRRCP